MKTQSVGVAITTVAGIYFVAYFCLVEIDPASQLLIVSNRTPVYQFGGPVAERFFFPAHQLDRLIRRDRWVNELGRLPTTSGSWHLPPEKEE